MPEARENLFFNESDVEGGETPSRTGKCLDAFELTDEPIRQLERRVQQSAGEIRVFIHPFFEADFGHYEVEQTPKGIEKIKAIHSALKRMISSSFEKNPPPYLFLFLKTLKRVPIRRNY